MGLFFQEVLMSYLKWLICLLLVSPDALGATRFISVDPDREGQSPYVYVANQPLEKVDLDGHNAKVVINEKKKRITVKAKILVYGSAADKATAKMMEQNIKTAWNGHRYHDPNTGTDYEVVFKVKVRYRKRAPKNVAKRADRNAKINFIELPANQKRSYVMVQPGYTGVWRGRDMITQNWGDPAPHEFGHLLGLDDRYTRGKANPGWQGNIMAESAMRGHVDSRNLSLMLTDAMVKHNQNLRRAQPKRKTIYEIRPKGFVR